MLSVKQSVQYIVLLLESQLFQVNVKPGEWFLFALEIGIGRCCQLVGFMSYLSK